ncbi:vascular cell adhesion protein 1 [Paramormyrops kingsleyae]|uniref:vascular cell adhesion protein 1 n=1 Tax=Paramormyrops kingsleyae TaxID=1676925 RepID=UPI003B978482
MKMLLLLITFVLCSAADGCLELHPPTVVVRHGDPVSVNCTVSADHGGMGWAAPVDDVPNTPGVQFLTWRVESLRIWDIKPLCFANRPGEAQCMERLSVTVYKPPDSVSVSSVNSADFMVEGSQYQLKCEIQNIAPVQNLTVKWYKGDTLVHGDRDYVTEDGNIDREKEPVSVSSTLLITPSRADDGAEYSCGAELDLGPEGPQPPLEEKSTPLNITVHYPPVIKEGTVSVTVPQGGTVSLSCSAEGKPPPQVQWSYRDAGNVRVTSSGGNSTAVITEASSANEGVYNCTATNWLGSDTATVFVTVTRTSTRPPPDTTTAFVTVSSTRTPPITTRSQMAAAADGCLELHPPRVVVRHGDPVSVNCTVSTNHSGMGWAAPVDDVPITPGVQFLTWRVESLRIWDLKPLCYANRPGKQCKERLSVTVYKPPDNVSVSSMNSTDPMVEGSQYQLKCEIQNIAPVQNLTVKWYKGDILVHEDRDYVTEDGKSDSEKAPVNVSSTLLITPSRADDGAEYSCWAELHLGPEGPQPPLAVKSIPLNITVHYPPKIKVGHKNVTVPQGGTVSLSCSAEGSPPPQVRWNYRDAGNVRVTSSGGNRTTVITEASSANEGFYNCTATNWLGSDTAAVFVTVTSTNMIVGFIIFVVVIIIIIIVIVIFCKMKNQRGSYSFMIMRPIITETNGAARSLSANGTQN